MAGPSLSVIVVNYKRAEMTVGCLRALDRALQRLGEPHEVIVVDNGSGDGSPEALRAAAPSATVVELPRNRGFPAAASEGIRRSRGELVLLLNNDVLVEPEAVAEMVAAIRSAPDVGSVAAQMRFADGSGAINSAGIGVDRLGIAYDRLLGLPPSASEDRPIEVFGASGGAALHRRRMLDEVGGMDETYFFALDDADLAWRARMAGWRCLYAPAAIVHHHHGATTAHGSDLKYFHVGLNRVRTLAKNADRRMLARYGAAALAYDLAYVAYAAVTDRTLAPLRGRVRGLREWRTYRRAATGRRAVELAPVRGLGAALERRRAWQRHSAVRQERGRSVNAPGRAAGPRALVVFHLAGVGGPSRSLVGIVGRLAERGSVDVLVPAAGDVAEQYRDLAAVRVAPYAPLSYARGPRESARELRRLARDVRTFRDELRRTRPDLVVVVTTVLPAALVAARLERVPAVVYAAELLTQEWKRSPARRAAAGCLAKATESLAAGIVCCSRQVAEQFGPRPGKPIAVAYPPVGGGYAGGDRAATRRRYGVETADPCVLTAGALSRGRGQDVAIRALARVRERFPHARLLVVGAPHPLPADAAYAAELRQLARELDLADAVVFTGTCDDMPGAYAAADVVVNPARLAESFGRVAAEAMVAGRPVVSTDLGAVPEVIDDGVDGLLVPPDDPHALAEAVIRVHADARLAARLAANGRERALARFGAEQDLRAWSAVVEAVAPRFRRDPDRSVGPAAAHDGRERLEEDLHVLPE